MKKEQVYTGTVTGEELGAQPIEEVHIDEAEMVDFIHDELAKTTKHSIDKEDIAAVLDLEFEFLKLKGVIEE
ncbi:hypothetical protein [Bacillus sp. AG4(2022)]|uniref:hypothetical protein n=1 Tax=Bacillus sp. AG4(2022) TaxID=2962594 RepID=UPI002880E411|nr:hypothetical protein [Bacillus sp. AG4(2022)]MDT0160475.1 hypothetical protein [Bacillus sp. AG4(2022)]